MTFKGGGGAPDPLHPSSGSAHECHFCQHIKLRKEEHNVPHRENRGSYMSVHVLLNLLNELGKRDKMRGLPSILSLFRNEFNKFNNTRARMLDSIYHMTNTLKSQFWRKNVMILSLLRNVVMDVITFPVNL